jgi:hypothetical protein
MLLERIPAAGRDFAVLHPQPSQVGDDHWFPVVSSIQPFCAVVLVKLFVQCCSIPAGKNHGN